MAENVFAEEREKKEKQNNSESLGQKIRQFRKKLRQTKIDQPEKSVTRNTTSSISGVFANIFGYTYKKKRRRK